MGLVGLKRGSGKGLDGFWGMDEAMGMPLFSAR